MPLLEFHHHQFSLTGIEVITAGRHPPHPPPITPPSSPRGQIFQLLINAHIDGDLMTC